jgi:hypothetical protein
MRTKLKFTPLALALLLGLSLLVAAPLFARSDSTARGVGPLAGAWRMTVDSSLVRDLVGQRLTRVFDVSGDTLVLTPPDLAEGWRATYERM